MSSVAPQGTPRTIAVPGNGTQTISFVWPSGVSLDPQAVFAVVDATGAGGPVTATLTIAEQSGVVIAAKRQGETIDAGAPGSATWALRLADEIAAGGSATTSSEAFRDAAGVLVAPNSTTVLPWVHDFGANVLNLGAPNLPNVQADAAYLFTVWANPLSVVGAAYTCNINLRLALNGVPNFYTSTTTLEALTVLASGLPVPAARAMSNGNTLDVRIRHNAIANVRFGLYGSVVQVG